MPDSPARKREPLDQYIAANVTKTDLALIERIMNATGASKAGAIRMLIHAGAASGRWDAFTAPRDE
jgi:hypothetical protein